MSPKTNKWSITTVNTLRQCNRKYYFSSVLPSKTYGDKLKRKAYDLKQMKNLAMWAGTIVDKVMELIVVPMIHRKEGIDFNKIANEALELARKQFAFSESRDYNNPGIVKKEVLEQWCILDVHEIGRAYTEEDINKIYNRIRESILNIPQLTMPGTGKFLVDYIAESNPILPNVTTWSFEIESARVTPQMDLILYNNFKPVVIDWKVSDSYISDYSRQLLICGLTVYFTRLKKVNEGKKPYEYSDIKLYEVNLYHKEIKEHLFTAEMANELVDYINLTGSDITLLRNELTEDKGHDINLFDITENESTCSECNFQTLCQFMIINKNQYDETAYTEFVQGR